MEISMELSTEEIHSDNYWINNNNTKQSKNIRFPTFDIPSLDNQVLNEVTLDIIEHEITALVETLLIYEEFYEKLITIKNKDIIRYFSTHDLKYFNYKVFSEILRREMILLSHILKLKYGFNDELLNQKIEKELLMDEERFYSMISDVKFMNINFTDEEKRELREIVKQALKYEEELINSKDIDYKPSLTSLCILLKFIRTTIQDGINNIKLLLKENSEKVILDFLNILIKFEVFITLIPLCIRVKEDDLFNLSEESETWSRMKNNFERRVPYSNDKIKPKLQKLFDFVNLGYASVFKGDTTDNKYLKFMYTGYFMTYFFFNKNRASIESKRFSLRPKFETSRRVWNLLDTNIMKHALKGVLAGIRSIKYRKKLYVKRQDKEITSEYIKEITNIVNSYGDHVNSNSNKQIKKVNKSIIDEFKIDTIENDIKNIDTGELFASSVDKHNKINYVKIKLLSPKEFYVPSLRSRWNLFNCCLVERNFTRNALIIHIHGGGFVSMSSSSHENYLRKWSNKLEVPVISIDYRLAPENPYPNALDDVWQAYNWIITNAQDEFKINLEKIILIGDSAGGNLALSLIYLLITHDKRLPDALFLAYPGIFKNNLIALRLTDDYYSSSYLLSLNDVILSYQLLKFCLQSYKKDYRIEDDFLLSPILAPDKLLKLLPPVRILVGSSDPLRDDSFRLLERLSLLEKDVKLFEFKYFPHGFLSYDLPMMLPEASVANDLIVDEIEKFLSTYN